MKMWNCRLCRVNFNLESVEQHVYTNHLKPTVGSVRVFNCGQCSFVGESFEGIAHHCLEVGHEPTAVKPGSDFDKYYRLCLFQTLKEIMILPQELTYGSQVSAGPPPSTPRPHSRSSIHLRHSPPSQSSISLSSSKTPIKRPSMNNKNSDHQKQPIKPALPAHNEKVPTTSQRSIITATITTPFKRPFPKTELKTTEKRCRSTDKEASEIRWSNQQLASQTRPPQAGAVVEVQESVSDSRVVKYLGGLEGPPLSSEDESRHQSKQLRTGNHQLKTIERTEDKRTKRAEPLIRRSKFSALAPSLNDHERQRPIVFSTDNNNKNYIPTTPFTPPKVTVTTTSVSSSSTSSNSTSKYSCSSCFAQLSTLYAAEMHERNDHHFDSDEEERRRPHRCDQCDKSYCRRDVLISHRFRRHNIMTTTAIDSSSSMVAGGMETNDENDDDEEEAEEEVDEGHQELIEMELSVGEAEDEDQEEPIKSFICETCGRSFVCQSDLDTHERRTGHESNHNNMSSSKEPSLIHFCSQCGKRFKTPYTLKRHVMAMHR